MGKCGLLMNRELIENDERRGKRIKFESKSQVNYLNDEEMVKLFASILAPDYIRLST